MNKARRVFVMGNHVQACCWHVERLPRAGETFQATRLTVEPGGKGLNVSIGLHRLGLQVHTVLGCGRDAAGDAVVQLLQDEGMDTTGVLRFEGASGWGAGLISADGQNAIAVYPGANLLLTGDHVRAMAAELDAADLVYGQFETALEAVEQAFAMAHARGICTVLNPSPWQSPPPGIRQTTRVLIVNETEAAGLLGQGNQSTGPMSSWTDVHTAMCEGVASVWAEWPALDLLVVTLGALGASAWLRPQDGSDEKVVYMPAVPVDAVDTVGAGDAFAVGFVSECLRQDRPAWHEPALLEQCLCTGQVMGAHMASTVGVLAGLPLPPLLLTLVRSYSLSPVIRTNFPGNKRGTVC